MKHFEMNLDIFRWMTCMKANKLVTLHRFLKIPCDGKLRGK